MGVFVSTADFFGRFLGSFGTFEGKPFLFLANYAATGYARRLNSTLRSDSGALYKFSLEDDTFETVSHNDPRLSLSLPHYGYYRESGVTRYVVPVTSSSTSSSIGAYHFKTLWSSDKEDDWYTSLDRIPFVHGMRDTILKRFDKITDDKDTIILNSHYCISRVGYGDDGILRYNGARVLGSYDFKNKQLKVFSGPASELHRKRIKELIHVSDSV